MERLRGVFISETSSIQVVKTDYSRMSKRAFLATLSALAAGALISACADGKGTDDLGFVPEEELSEVSTNSEFANELFDLTNQARRENGILALTFDEVLTQVARQRSLDMATNDYFSHTSPEGVTAFTMLGSRNYSYRIVGENIARNNYPDDKTAGTAHEGFMNSQSHKANILNSGYKFLDIGHARSGDMNYFTQLFVG